MGYHLFEPCKEIWQFSLKFDQMPIIELQKKIDLVTLNFLIESLFGYISSKKEAAPKQGKTQKKENPFGNCIKIHKERWNFHGNR